MKKNAIIIMSALLSAAVIAALCIVNFRNDKLLNANVKALASGDISGSYSKSICYSVVNIERTDHMTLFCGICQFRKGLGVKEGGTCRNAIITINEGSSDISTNPSVNP